MGYLRCMGNGSWLRRLLKECDSLPGSFLCLDGGNIGFMVQG